MQCNPSNKTPLHLETSPIKINSGSSPRSLLSESIRSSQTSSAYIGKTNETTVQATSIAKLLNATFRSKGSEPGLAIPHVSPAIVEHYSLAWKLDNLSKNMDQRSGIVHLGDWGTQHSAAVVARIARYISPLIDDPELLHPKFQPIDSSKLADHATALGQELRHIRMN